MGLLHVRADYHDQQMGRFTSRDAVLSEHPFARQLTARSRLRKVLLQMLAQQSAGAV